MAIKEELLKVAFIDDEKLVRKLLINCVDWNLLSYEVAGESPGGQHALDMISHVRPDLIFVDICMPIVDGMQMSSYIMQMLPESRVVILTGHQEFEYARKSIKIGVFDYLLKPINPNEISETARKVKDEIRQKSQERQQIDEIRHKLEDNYPRLREQYLEQLINGDQRGDPQSLEYFSITIIEPYCQVAVVSVDFMNAPEAFNDVSNVLTERLSQSECVHCFCCGGLHVVWSNNSGLDLYKALEFIRSELYAGYQCILSAGISNANDDPYDIQEACTQAREAFNYRLYFGKGRIIRYQDILSEGRGSYPPDDSIELLKFYLKSGLIKNAEVASAKALEELTAKEPSGPESLHTAGVRVLSACLSVMMECNIPESEIFGREGNAVEAIFTMEALPQMKQHMRRYVNEIAYKIFDINKSSAHGVVHNIRKYVESSISDPNLSLSSVAARFYLNPSYLSRIYRQVTGSTFVEDVNKMRMDIVIRSLNQDDRKVYELCERVGIEDPHYLSILFKKHTGMTISEYKNMLKKQGSKGEQQPGRI